MATRQRKMRIHVEIRKLALMLVFLALSVNAHNLPVGDLNVVVLTDVHSWIGGHRDKEPRTNADYGTVLSFYQLLKEQIQSQNEGDVWLVMNGDWIDGTGLALNGNPSHLIPLLQKMPFDAVNIGNHELYKREVIEAIIAPGGFAEWWGTRYLSSNVERADTDRPVGHRYHILRGRKANVLAFGFLYNMIDNDGLVQVEKVEDVVKEEWFLSALSFETYDAILVLAHMDHHDSLVEVIIRKIREIIGFGVAVQFITGHTHYRGYSEPDRNSASFEAGRYLDTVGFVSFPTAATISAQRTIESSSATKSAFQHAFIDASYEALSGALGEGGQMVTDEGLALSEFILSVQTDLGLREIVGCSRDSYFLDKGLDEDYSLWRLFQQQVVPFVFNGERSVVVLEKGTWRYDLLKGDLVLDELIAVSPFNETLYRWRDIPGDTLGTLNSRLNESRDPSLPNIPDYIFSLSMRNDTIKRNETYDLVVDAFEKPTIAKVLNQIYPASINVEPIPTNYTSTSIWIDFFSRAEVCTTASKGKTKTTARWPLSENVPYDGPALDGIFEGESDSSNKKPYAWLVLSFLFILGWLARRIWKWTERWRLEILETEQESFAVLEMSIRGEHA